MAPDQLITAKTLKQFLEAFNRHDLDAIMELFAENSVVLVFALVDSDV